MPGRGLNLLSLDGGGIRGLSSLQVLKNVLERVAHERGLREPPKPCEFFDMIGGTSTGGLIAIMLGRMKMTIDECIEAYVKLSDSVFRQTRLARFSLTGKVRGKFDSKALEEAVKEHLIGCSLSEDCLLQDIDPRSCKIFVCATSGSTRKTVVLSSYATRRTNSDRLKYTRVWQAARATSAASGFFDAIDVQLGSYKESYTDGATGANNPINVLWHEAKEAFLDPGELLEDHVDCVVSIGTGIPAIESFGSSLKSIAKSIVAISTETEETAKVFRRTHEALDKSERYFRFNVAHGLEKIGLERTDCKDDIINITNLYLEEDATHELMEKCVNALKEHEGDARLNLQPNRAIALKSYDGINARSRFASVGVNDRRVVQRGTHDLLDSISVYDHEACLKSISTRVVPGTSRWILSNDTFESWRAHTSRPFLLCTGIVGSGKTMIASSVVETLLRDLEDAKGVVAHYFLDAKYPQELSMTAVLRGIIRQLVSSLRNTKYLPQLFAEMLHKTFGLKTTIHSSSVLYAILQKLLSAASYSIIVLDGLHEMPEHDASSLLEVIRQLSASPTLTGKIKFAIFTREEIGRRVNILTALPEVVHLKLTINLLEDDIAFFIDERIRQKTMYEHQITENEALLEDMRSTVRENGEKMFLWIDLQLNTIWNTCMNDEDIRNTLNGLPMGIEETYTRCLERISEDPIANKYGYSIIYLTAYAQRPLNQVELREAISVPDMSDHLEEKKLVNGPLLRFCANLVEQDHLTAIIRFVHPSVKAFLEAHLHPAHYNPTSVITGRLYRSDSSFQAVGTEYCRDLCFKYLTMHDFGSQVALSSSIRTAVNKAEVIDRTLQSGNKVARWAVRVRHLTKKGLGKSTQESPMVLETRKQTLHNWQEDQYSAQKYHLLAYIQDHWPCHVQGLRPNDPAWPVFQALATKANSAYRLHPWTDLSMNPIQTAQSLFIYAVARDNLPLLWTIQENFKPKQVSMLIKMATNDRFEQACHLAVSREVLDWLIRVGGTKQLTRRDVEGNTPLHSAAANGNFGALSSILDHVSAADIVTSRNNSNDTPIVLAFQGSSLEVIDRAMQAIQLHIQAVSPRRPKWKAEDLEDALKSILRLRPNYTNRLAVMENYIKIIVEALLEVHKNVSWSVLIDLAMDDDIFIFFDLFLEHPNSRSIISGTTINKPPDAPIGGSILTKACSISATTKPDRSRIVELFLEYLPEEIVWHTVREKEGAEKVDIIWPLSLAMSQLATSAVAVDIVRVLSKHLLRLSEQRKYVPQMIEEFSRPHDGDLDYMEILQRIDPKSVEHLLLSGALKLQQHSEYQPKTTLLHCAVMKEDPGLVQAMFDYAVKGKAHNLVYYLAALSNTEVSALSLAINEGRRFHALIVVHMILLSLDFEDVFFEQRVKDGERFRDEVDRLLVDTSNGLLRALEYGWFRHPTSGAIYGSVSELVSRAFYAEAHTISWGCPFKYSDAAHKERLARIRSLIDSDEERSVVGSNDPRVLGPQEQSSMLQQAEDRTQTPVEYDSAGRPPTTTSPALISPQLAFETGNTDGKSNRSSLSGESVYLSAHEDPISSE